PRICWPKRSASATKANNRHGKIPIMIVARLGRFAALVLAIGAMALGATLAIADPSSSASDLPKDRAGLDQAIHDYLMSHPDVVVDTLKAAQQQADAKAAEQSRRAIMSRQKELLDDADDLVQGNP